MAIPSPTIPPAPPPSSDPDGTAAHAAGALGVPPTTHHHRPRRRVVVLVLLLAVGIGVLLGPRLVLPPHESTLTASGTVEADEVVLGFEVAGRISAVLVREGQPVSAGDVIARLDDATAQLQFRQADPATRQQIELQIDKYTVRSPLAGTVTRMPAHVGEVTPPGQTIAAVADLSNLRLTVYVLETDLGRVFLGQTVIVTADPFPRQEFRGVVTSINQRAEFTPRNVQSQRDRQNLVFGVKVSVENPSQALKPGLPVDARFEER